MTPGTPIGLNDRNGQPVHIGDTLEFDARQWGGECRFVVEWADGELGICGCPSDISEWCTVVKPFPQMTAAQELRLRATYLEDAAASLREKGNAIRAGSRAPWQANPAVANRISLGQDYFNAAVAARRLSAELRALADQEEKNNGIS